jgi:hypothetical protein
MCHQLNKINGVVRELIVLGVIRLCVYRVVGPSAGRGPTPRLFKIVIIFLQSSEQSFSPFQYGIRQVFHPPETLADTETLATGQGPSAAAGAHPLSCCSPMTLSSASPHQFIIGLSSSCRSVIDPH